MLKNIILSALLFSATIGSVAAQNVSSYIITIQSVQLLAADGRWVTVIEPDRQVDLLKEEPSVSFFNNGRVEPGEYMNVKIVLSGRVKEVDSSGVSRYTELRGSLDRVEIFKTDCFEKPLVIKKGSFAGVWFTFDKIPPSGISEVALAVDQTQTRVSGNEITIRP